MRRLAVTLGVLAALGLVPATATAGTYQVSACNSAAGFANNSWTWATSDPTHFASHTSCPYLVGGSGGITDQEGGLSTTDALGASSGAPPGSSAAWTFTAPAGTTISAISYARYLGHALDTTNVWAPALRADGQIVPGEACTVILPATYCTVGFPPPPDPSDTATVNGLAAGQLAFGEVCQAPSGQVCVTGAGAHSVWAAMYASTVTLNDTSPPTLSPPAGVLWGPGPAAGFHKGTETVTAAAQDAGGGVASVVLSADGHAIQNEALACDFTRPQPCPSSTGPVTLTLPTTQLPDGAHTLTIVAYDAAGNASGALSRQVAIVNGAPPPPTGLAASATKPGGTVFAATWNNPAGQVAPITGGTYQVCPAAGGTCLAPEASDAPNHATVAVPRPGMWTLAVWLTNAAGNSDPAHPARIALNVGPRPDPALARGQGSNLRLRVSEALHGRRLIVTVAGPQGATVRVRYAARYHGRIIDHAARTVHLRSARVVLGFQLSAAAASSASVRVIARLDHQPPVTSTLRRTRPPRSRLGSSHAPR